MASSNLWNLLREVLWQVGAVTAVTMAIYGLLSLQKRSRVAVVTAVTTKIYGLFPATKSYTATTTVQRVECARVR